MSTNKPNQKKNKNRPRLVILTLDFRPDLGGVQEYLYESAKRLSRDFDVVVLTPITETNMKNPSFQRVVLSSNSPLFIFKQLRKLKPDFTLVGHAHPKLLLAAKLFGNYGLITYGNDFLAGQRQWHRLLFNALIRQANPLIAISDATKSRLNSLGINPGFIIHPGTDPKRFTPLQPRLVHPYPILLTIARLVPRKGIDTVIKSLPDLLKIYPNLQYHIGGQGPDLERLQSIACEAQVTHAVRFLGRISEETLPEVYRTADIFVMPAREEDKQTSVEGFGIVFLEASASGLPIVASRSGGIGEAVLDGNTGILILPDNVDACRDVFLTLLASPEEQKRLGDNGRCWVEEKMNWDQTAQKLIQALGVDVS